MAPLPTIKIISKRELNVFIDNLIQKSKSEVIGVKAKGERYVFAPLTDASELCLNYDVTILPPKKYFLPQYEPLMNYDLKKPFKVEKNLQDFSRILIGVHPYDIIALEQSDKVYLDPQKDDFYDQRRKNTIIIGADIQKVSKRSFAASMNTHITDSGFDLLLTNIGSHYAITIGSEKGKKLLEKYASTKIATEDDRKKIEKTRESIVSNYKKKVKVEKEQWSSTLVANYDHALWEEKSDRCLGCSSCTMVCPTCYCYDIKDDVTFSLKDGTRIRTWDGCLLHDFTKISSGEVFRDDIRDRYRHRFYRKGNYLPARYDFVACVGCGRCGIACLPDIADPCDVLNELSHLDYTDGTHKFFIEQKKKPTAVQGTIHLPRSATIQQVKRLTESEIYLQIELDDKKPLGHSPGQFVEISLFGIGEAPISISSAPGTSPLFELVVRKVGNVTSKLFTMKKGDKVGIRGPFGNGFTIKDFENKHLLFVLGGLGLPPMRSLINYILDKKNRQHFKDVTILYGCKQPCQVLFLDEIKKWQKMENVVCKLTVDQCEKNECWAGEVGLITTLFPEIKIDKSTIQDTMAIVIGPPIMYKFVIKCLQTLGVPDTNIFVSLERRMKCGVGKCGHCQINGVYVCREGPVFKYNDIKNLPEAFE